MGSALGDYLCVYNDAAGTENRGGEHATDNVATGSGWRAGRMAGGERQSCADTRQCEGLNYDGTVYYLADDDTLHTGALSSGRAWSSTRYVIGSNKRIPSPVAYAGRIATRLYQHIRGGWLDTLSR